MCNLKFSGKKKGYIITLSVLIVLTLSFIWGNSLLSKSASANTSGGVYNFFKPIIDFIFGEGNFTHAHFRKLAHFSEFFVLGVEIYLLFRVIYGNIRCKVITILLLGFFAGLIDESLQIISSRGASFLDVLIDFLGYSFAIIISMIFSIVIYKIKHRKCLKAQ